LSVLLVERRSAGSFNMLPQHVAGVDMMTMFSPSQDDRSFPERVWSRHVTNFKFLVPTTISLERRKLKTSNSVHWLPSSPWLRPTRHDSTTYFVLIGRSCGELGRIIWSHINEVTLRRARLVLGWVTAFGRHASRLGLLSLLSSTGPGNEYRPRGMLWGWGSKGRYGSFHLWINVWKVNTVCAWLLVQTCHT